MESRVANSHSDSFIRWKGEIRVNTPKSAVGLFGCCIYSSEFFFLLQGSLQRPHSIISGVPMENCVEVKPDMEVAAINGFPPIPDTTHGTDMHGSLMMRNSQETESTVRRVPAIPLVDNGSANMTSLTNNYLTSVRRLEGGGSRSSTPVNGVKAKTKRRGGDQQTKETKRREIHHF